MSKVKNEPTIHDKKAKAPEADRPRDARKYDQGSEQPTPTPGADVDSEDGIQSGRGRNTGMTDEDATAKNKPGKDGAKQATAQKK